MELDLHNPLSPSIHGCFPERPVNVQQFDASAQQKEYFTESRHKYLLALQQSQQDEKDQNSSSDSELQPWRLKERMRTVSVGLIGCFNIGVDPPDIVKPQPCARLEAWIDPLSMPPPKALDAIGTALQRQYAFWQPRAKYKWSMDPTIDEVKRLCKSLRRTSKAERVLFHYNGHGVPKPSASGELWVFNHHYTQYMPLSIFDLQSWVGSPAIYVFDCSAAGLIVNKFGDARSFPGTSAHNPRMRAKRGSGTSTAANDGTGKGRRASTHRPSLSRVTSNIVLAACGANEILPVNPEFPADIFTCCLTTPIRIALRWFSSRSVLTNVSPELIDKIPGRTIDRKSPLGELNWIFTAITDTIAWNVLPQDLFQRLFRQDLLVASLFRNFLLAERILRSFNCVPVSSPALPPTYKHVLWQSWDLAAEFCLSQLSAYVQHGKQFTPSSFFSDQLTAFDVWLQFGSEKSEPPMQLPIVLQVLLSQVHRLRALVLLARFLDKGKWAVNLALSVGIFPYVLKLLQSPALELKEVLVFIWTKILCYDRTCQADLVKNQNQRYFLGHLAGRNTPTRERIMCLVVLSVMAHRFPTGQLYIINSDCFELLLRCWNTDDALFRRWLCLCTGVLWERYEEAKQKAIQLGLVDHVCQFLADPVAEVRAAAVFAVGTFFGQESNESRTALELVMARKIGKLIADGSPLVRLEVVVALAELAYFQQEHFIKLAVSKPSQDRVANDNSAYSRSVPRNPGSGGRSHDSVMDSPLGGFASPPYGQTVDVANSGLNPPHLSLSGSKGSIGSASSGSKYSRISGRRGSTDSQHSVPPQTPPRPRALGSGNGHSNPAMTPAGHSVSGRERTPHHQRMVLWSVINSASKDPMPVVATAATHLKEYIKGRSSTLTRGLTRDSSVPDMARMDANYHRQAVPNVHPQTQQPHRSGARFGTMAYRQFNRYKPDAVPPNQQQAAPQKQDAPKLKRTRRTNKISRMASDSRHDFDDPRDNDPAWLVPKSAIYDMSIAHYNRPLMEPPESSESAESIFNKRWRYRRNAGGDEHAKALLMNDKFDSVKGTFEQIAVFHSGLSQIGSLCFHPYENLLFAADNRDTIGVWDYKELEQINRFSNKNPRGTRLTHMSLVNDLHVSLLMTGSDDGVVRVWKDVHCKDKSQLVTAWIAVRDLPRRRRHRHGTVSRAATTPSHHNSGNSGGSRQTPLTPSAAASGVYASNSGSFMSYSTPKKNTGADTANTPAVTPGGGNNGLYSRGGAAVTDPPTLGRQSSSSASFASPQTSSGSYTSSSSRGPNFVLTWDQTKGYVIASGATQLIRVWEIETEACILDTPAISDAGVTSLCSAANGNIFAAGYGDGAVRVFDIRTPNCFIKALNKHRGRVIKVHMQRGGFADGRLISADLKGDVILSDLRISDDSISKITAHQTRPLNSMAVHDYSPLIATGSYKQFIKIFDTNGTTLNVIKYHEGFLGQRIGPVSSLSFHRTKLLLAAGAMDAFISIHAGDESSLRLLNVDTL